MTELVLLFVGIFYGIASLFGFLVLVGIWLSLFSSTYRQFKAKDNPFVPPTRKRKWK